MFPAGYFSKTYFTGSYFAPNTGVTPPSGDGNPQYPILLVVMGRMGARS